MFTILCFPLGHISFIAFMGMVLVMFWISNIHRDASKTTNASELILKNAGQTKGGGPIAYYSPQAPNSQLTWCPPDTGTKTR